MNDTAQERSHQKGQSQTQSDIAHVMAQLTPVDGIDKHGKTNDPNDGAGEALQDTTYDPQGD